MNAILRPAITDFGSMDQLELTPVDASPRIDPWAVVRAEHAGKKLARVILTQANLQLWLDIDACEWQRPGLVDGSTIFSPCPPNGYTPDEKAALIKRADAAWQIRHATAPTE
jgi:hypothetical protein